MECVEWEGTAEQRDAALRNVGNNTDKLANYCDVRFETTYLPQYLYSLRHDRYFVSKRRYEITAAQCITSRKNSDLICFAEED